VKALRAAGSRYRRLTKLRIDEVSTVDRGAGHGVDVVLRRRHDEHQALNEGMQAIADTHFGGSMANLLESNIGKVNATADPRGRSAGITLLIPVSAPRAGEVMPPEVMALSSR
jgi:hypothetical protein